VHPPRIPPMGFFWATAATVLASSRRMTELVNRRCGACARVAVVRMREERRRVEAIIDPILG
jgi:phosphoribosyl-dephospho-CoA transferase